MKILVVDDQESIGVMIAEIAREGNWESAYSSNALEVVQLVGEYRPDVLMIDQFMPGEKGLEIVAELRAMGNDLPVILFTGYPDDIDPAEMERLHIAKFLAKPISIRELRDVLKEIEVGVAG